MSINPPFLYSACDEAFVRALDDAAKRAPILGPSAAGTATIALAHYSRTPTPLTAFRRSVGHSWTNRVSQDPRGIGAFTGLYGEVFHALYVIRCVDHPGLRHRGSGLMEEYAIDRALAPGDFVRLPLRLESAKGNARYVIA